MAIETCECANCDWRGDVDDCLPARDFWSRVEPGDVVPAGDCPECGAFVFIERAPRVIGISLEGGLVQDVFCPDPAGLAYVVIDYDTDGQDPDDAHAARQDDGDWSRCYAHGGDVSQAPEMLIVPDPLGRSFDGPLVNLSFADGDGNPRELSFTLPASLAAAAHDEGKGIALALDDCASKIDVKVTHAPAVSPLLTPKGLET